MDSEQWVAIFLKYKNSKLFLDNQSASHQVWTAMQTII